jgi:hypothetical protein
MGGISPCPVDRKSVVDLRLPSHETGGSAVASVKRLGHFVFRYERQLDCIPAQGTFTLSVHAHVRRTLLLQRMRRLRIVCIPNHSAAHR